MSDGFEDDDMGHAEEPAICEALNTLLLQLIRDEYNELAIRPVDGELRVNADFEDLHPPEHYQLVGMVDRLKIMADLDLATEEVEQSGRIELNIRGAVICLRVTTLPSDEGEGVLIIREG